LINVAPPTTVRETPGDSLALWIAQRHGSAADYRVLNERENDRLALSKASGERSVAHTTALRQTHDAQIQYSQIQTSVRRPLNKTTIRTAFFVAFVLALALLEAPVNKYLLEALSGDLGRFRGRTKIQLRQLSRAALGLDPGPDP
jgi:hypothetical protein